MDLFFIFTEDLDQDSEAKQEVLENLSKLKELEQKELLSQNNLITVNKMQSCFY